jgi:hypothetical protein
MMQQPWPAAAALRAAVHAQAAGTGGWTIAAVVVAGLAAAVVAWQAWETHRTTSLAQEALRASHSLAIDSARSRLDQNAPRVEVYVEEVSAVLGNTPGSRQGRAARWTLPDDGAQLLRVQAEVVVANPMQDRTVHLKVHGLHGAAMRTDNEILLDRPEKLSYFLAAELTLSQWAENWEAHQTGKPLPHVAEGRVISRDDRDEGVVDTWRLHLAAWPIEPAEGSGRTWQMTGRTADRDWFQMDFRPLRERKYWISQRNGIEMPDPVYHPPR